jgi:hypothetical protein
MITYFNIRTAYGVETVDELDSKDFPMWKDFRKETFRLISEYHLAGMNVYTSSRCTKEWKNSYETTTSK